MRSTRERYTIDPLQYGSKLAMSTFRSCGLFSTLALLVCSLIRMRRTEDLIPSAPTRRQKLKIRLRQDILGTPLLVLIILFPVTILPICIPRVRRAHLEYGATPPRVLQLLPCARLLHAIAVNKRDDTPARPRKPKAALGAARRAWLPCTRAVCARARGHYLEGGEG